MKLSEAIMLGSVTCKMEPGNMNSCAFGAALNAVGVPQESWAAMRYTPLVKMWPWLRLHGGTIQLSDLGETIYRKFDLEVCTGSMTLEQLVDYVRSIEPDCGECNQFACTCTKPAAPEVCEVIAYV